MKKTGAPLHASCRDLMVGGCGQKALIRRWILHAQVTETSDSAPADKRMELREKILTGQGIRPDGTREIWTEKSASSRRRKAVLAAREVWADRIPHPESFDAVSVSEDKEKSVQTYDFQRKG